MAASHPQQPQSRLADLWALLKWWARIPLPPTMEKAEKDRFRAEITASPSAVRQAALPALVRQYEEVKSDLNSTRSRAGNLLAATGVISGVVALTAGFTNLFQVHSWVGFIGLGLAAVVVYSAVGATFLAIRAQQVDFWGQAELHPNEMSGSDPYEIEYATALYIIWRENLARLAVPVGYLRDAQVYFRALVIALGLLVLVTVGSNLTITTKREVAPAQTHASQSRSSP